MNKANIDRLSSLLKQTMAAERVFLVMRDIYSGEFLDDEKAVTRIAELLADQGVLAVDSVTDEQTWEVLGSVPKIRNSLRDLAPRRGCVTWMWSK